MKKVLLFLFLINLSLFAQSYINSLYDAIEENNTKKIIDIVNNYKIDLNNIFSMRDAGFHNDIEVIYGDISPLIYAIYCKNTEAIDTLLKLGANVGQFTDIYYSGSGAELIDLMDYHANGVSITPLMYAAYSSSEEVISFLIKKGAKVNVKDIKGRTALMYGSSEALIRAGADVNAKDNEGRTALMYGSSEALIRAGADVNVKDNVGKTALMYASENNSEEVDLLIKNKANINAKDKGGYTALIYACRGNYSPMSSPNYASLDPDTVKLLVRAGANINEVSKYGDTALTFAISVYKTTASFNFYWKEDELNDDTLPIFETIRFLIYNGANVNIKNKYGETPLSLAGGFPKLTKLLKDNGAY